MSKHDSRPFAQKAAMWLIKSPLGLKISARGRKKAAALDLDGVQNETVQIRRRDGNGGIRARIYRPLDSTGPLPIVVFFHGGGYATGWPERHHAFFKRLMDARPCIIVAPAFRLSIEAPYPAGHNDCYETVLWARDHAENIGGRADWVGVAGNSSGGGLALATALRARDTGELHLAFQMPFYPMIDDRPNRWTDLPDDQATWTKRHGVLAWHLLLKDLRARKRYDIPAYAAPARAEDLSGLPPTLSYVGTRDILRAESEIMADRLRAAGNDIRFRLFDGLFHAMEDSVPETPEAKAVHGWVAGEFRRLIDISCPA